MRWWSIDKQQGSSLGAPKLDSIADLYEIGSVSLVLDALENGGTIYRFTSQGASSLTVYGSLATGSTGFIANGGRQILTDEEVETYEKGSFFAWDDGVALLTYDGTNVKVDFCTNVLSLYNTVKTIVSGALHP